MLDRNREQIVGTFCEKELEKANKKEFRGEKVIKRKVKKRNYILNGNTMIVLLIVGLINE